MFGDGTWEQVKPALFAERRIARDDRAANAEPRHVVGHDLLRFRQNAGQKRAQQFQRVSEGLGRCGNVGVVVGYRSHGCASLLISSASVSGRAGVPLRPNDQASAAGRAGTGRAKLESV